MKCLKIFAVMFCGLVLCSIVRASGPAGNDDASTEKITQKRIVEHWLNVSRGYAKTYSIYPTGKPKLAYQLYKHPVFQHIQTIRGNDIGSVHLWVQADGRPAAIGTVFAWKLTPTRRLVFNEFHSLADEPISATRKGVEFWTSKTSGTNWTPLPGNAPTPQTDPRKRRLQAKQIERKFSAYMIDAKGKRWELRRVPTPIYEYDGKSKTHLGGSVFVFSRGTDTEAVLILAVRNSNGKLRWEFTGATFTDYDAHILWNGKEVWTPVQDAYQATGFPHFWAPVESREMPDFEKAP